MIRSSLPCSPLFLPPPPQSCSMFHLLNHVPRSPLSLPTPSVLFHVPLSSSPPPQSCSMFPSLPPHPSIMSHVPLSLPKALIIPYTCSMFPSLPLLNHVPCSPLSLPTSIMSHVPSLPPHPSIMSHVPLSPSPPLSLVPCPLSPSPPLNHVPCSPLSLPTHLSFHTCVYDDLLVLHLQLYLHSMCKYLPRVIVTHLSSGTSKYFSYPETTFIAVTVYHNQKVPEIRLGWWGGGR